MKLKKHIILFCLFVMVQLPLNYMYSQGDSVKPTRQSSFEAFSQGNYEKAYNQFRELLLTYSKDPLYKYYSGVCLVKLGKQPDEATNLLQEALQGGGNIKTLPSDGLFYLGRAHQMSGRFSEAIEAFNSYTKHVGKRAARDVGVPEYLKECDLQKGKIPEAEIILVSETRKEPDVENRPEVKPETVGPASVISRPVTEKIPVNGNLPVSYEQILSQAVDFQFKADSVSSIVSLQKKDLELLTGADKLSLKLKVVNNEKIAAAYQANADQKYKEAQIAMGSQGNDLIKPKETPLTLKDTIHESISVKSPVKQDSPKPPVRSTKPQVDIFSYFEVLDSPVTDPKAKITIDPEVPAGLIYRIQIAVFRNPATPAYFKGIIPVLGFKIPPDKIIYYAGMFRKSADAAKALAITRNKGFRDAFVVALVDNKKVSADRALQLEKEWGTKPFVSIESVSDAVRADTTTQTLIFRVEVMRTTSPLTEDVVDPIKRLAGERGLDAIQRLDGKISYLIGKFITFETAVEYADLLKRNGYKESQVVSWLGKKEIPIESAKKLFDDLK